VKHPPGGNGRAVEQMPQHARGAASRDGLLDGVVRVIVADRAWHYARALAMTLQLEHDLDVVGVAYGIDELLDLAGENDVDVIVLDVDLCTAAFERLRTAYPKLAVVGVGAAADRERTRRWLALGLRAYVVKRDSADPERIAQAVRQVARGESYFDREIQRLLVELASRAPAPALEARLTSRELELVPLIAAGLRNRQVASQLGVSEQTIRNHLTNIYRKLGATNRTQMTAEARRRGISA
jgi:DNA-binding NarL/FixJ family response regulator